MERRVIDSLINNQRIFFASGKTNDTDFRIGILKKIRKLILENEPKIINALWNDFHKPEFEVVATETRFVIKELNYLIRNLRRWSRPDNVATSLVHFIARSKVTYQPYGQVLVLAPWNFPFQLSFLPMIGAIAAGNTVVLKLSSKVPAIKAVIKEMLLSLPPEVIAIIDGDHDVAEYLLDSKFDFIFFTGSTSVGKHVMQKAAANLTPVALELGGKNPVVVAADARLDYAARRIAWGKFINCGQACVCPDYLLVDKKVSAKLLELIVAEIRKFYGNNASESDNYGRIVNSVNVKRLSDLISDSKIYEGGNYDVASSFFEPTILTGVSIEDKIMKEEIFGPILPVIEFDDFEEVYSIINKNPDPLSVYLFSCDKRLVRKFLANTRSGNATVNDTVIQIASSTLPYGGVGASGLGRYHGKKSFETFSNIRSVMYKSNLIDLPLRYPPYTDLKIKVIKLFNR